MAYLPALSLILNPPHYLKICYQCQQTHARSSSSVAQACQKILFHALQKNDNAFQVFSPATIPKIWNYIKEKKRNVKNLTLHL